MLFHSETKALTQFLEVFYFTVQCHKISWKLIQKQVNKRINAPQMKKKNDVLAKGLFAQKASDIRK